MADSSSTASASPRCITEHVTATLDYMVTNYLQLKGMGVGNFVRSPIYRIGGYNWDILFYPGGLDEDCNGNASSYLRYHGLVKDVNAKFTLSMLETNGQEQVASHDMMDDVFSPSPGTHSRGHAKFADRSKLKSMSRVGDGCFTIRCLLTVTNESPPVELPGHLERMLGDGRGTDVTFSVGGDEFCAHRFLLTARSPIFAAQLFGPMADKDMRHVEVTDMEPTIFGMMLRYIYTDSLPPCSDNGGAYNAPVMQHLLVAADRYGLDRLKQMCEEDLCKRMDVETVTTTLALADQHQCERLKKACVAFMASQRFKKHLKTCSPPLSLKGRSKEKRPSSVQRKYLLRSSKN
ncbi:unnamed protein product [Alopecurus aequalis]